jgi:anti-sigma B factor antagonist
MHIEIKKVRKACVVSLIGKLTLGEGDLQLRQEFLTQIEAGEQKFVLDLSRLLYLDSAGIGEIVACSKRAMERNGVIKIVLPAEGPVRKVFEITGLDRAFDLYENVADAVDNFWD